MKLDVSGLNYNSKYTVSVKNLLVDGETQADATAEFTTPGIQDLWDLKVTPASDKIEANGTDNTVVTFTLVDKVTGQVDTNANDIVLDLNTTFGSLAQKRATIQNGKASVLLRSEFIAQGATAKIDAQIIEASGDYKELIGEVVGTGTVVFEPSGSQIVDAINLTAANTNEADRVTLTFDKPVSLAQFITVDDNGSLTEELEDVIKVKQGDVEKTVVGFLPGATNNSVIAVLADDEFLTDNADVTVESTIENSLGKVTNSDATFKFTDARTPNVTSVTAEGLNKLVVKFSEPVAQADFLIDGRYNVDADDFKVEHGDFGFDKDAKRFVDERHIATITLTKYQEPEKDGLDYVYSKGYFKPGKHALQVSKIYDFAAFTDPNNIGSTQNLAFTIAENSDVAVASVKVDSPEQFRVGFDKEAVVVGNLNDVFELQVYNVETKEWDKATDVFTASADNKALSYQVKKINPGNGKLPEYKVELTEDWTKIYDTKGTKDNYYNDRFQLVVKEGSVQTVANGKLNAKEIVLGLNSAGSALNTPDTLSPTIKDIAAVKNTNGEFVVTMDEPVKLKGQVDGNVTLAQGQDDLPETKVEFIGKDKDGKTRTFIGDVGKYVTDGLDDKFFVNWKTGDDVQTPQDLVNAGGSEDWTVVVKSISDDVGNTAATVTRDFKITKEASAASKFMVAYTNGKNSADGYEVEGAEGDTVTITFTDSVALTGTESAIDTANFTLNGKDLPVGSSIALAPNKSVDDGGDGIDNNTIIITLTKGTLGATNVISLGKNLESADAKALIGEHTFTFKVLLSAVLEAAEKAVEDAEAAVTTAEGVVTAAEGVVTAAEGDVTTAEGAITTAEGVVTAAEGDVTTAEGVLVAAEAALEADDGSDTTITEGLKTAVEEAETALEEAKEALETAKTALETAEEALVTAEEALEAAEVALKKAEDALAALQA